MAVDIKQLRIGAHVEVNGIRARVEMLRHVRLSTCDAPHAVFTSIVDGEKRECGCFLDGDAVNPIPITPELLVELGVEQGSDEREWHKEIGEAWIGIHLFLDRERMRVTVCDDSADYGNMIVRYLHELENFVYLTLGKELIAE